MSGTATTSHILSHHLTVHNKLYHLNKLLQYHLHALLHL